MVSKKARTAERRDAYRIHRDRIVQEDQLIDHRMMWMLNANLILFALWGAFRATLSTLKLNLAEIIALLQ
jgi:hypothetical protein